jgi:hypothetical protein
METIIGGMRVALSEGREPFNPPPQELKASTPGPGFSAGMISPDWFSGAVHIFPGKVAINQYEFQGEKDYPLCFKVVKGLGYVHLCGKGTVAAKGQQPRQLGDKDSIAYWVKRSTSEDVFVREGCAQALGYLALRASVQDKGQARQALASLLSDRSYEVRRNAIEGIVRIAAAGEVVPRLKEIAESDENDWVKACAKWALSQTVNK